MRHIKETVTELKVMTARTEAQLPYLAATAEIATLRTDMQTGLANLHSEMQAGFTETPAKPTCGASLGSC